MKLEFSCPKCKKLLDISTNKLICDNCKKTYPNEENYIDFLGEKDFETIDLSKEKLREMIQDIHKHGYKKAVLQFLNDPVIKPYLIDVKSADSIFHCIGKNNLRCLEIGSNLGKITENLSHIFHEVYSLETSKEKIEIQKNRFQSLNQKNITLLRCNPLELPFPKDYFDLIICNDSFELCESYNSNPKFEKGQIIFLNEVKRILSKEGCFCVSVQNKFGFPRLFGVEKIKSLQNNQNSQTFSLSGYKQLFKKTNFYFKSYWVLPSIRKPYFSGKMEDDISYQWFFQNITNFLLKRKKSKFRDYSFSIIKKSNKFISKILTKNFIPSFIFCCYKSDMSKSLEDHIIANSDTKNFLMIGRRTRIIYILLGNNKKPTKLFSLDRYGYEIPEVIVECNRVFPKMKDPIERLWSEDWIDGHPIEPSKTNDVIAAFSWLQQFQNDTSDEIMTKEFVEETEIKWIKESLIKIKDIPLKKYETWLEEYVSYIDKHTIYKTAVHGDFWYSNILIESKTNSINVIDWENFKSAGNPFYDYILFMFNFMTMSNGNDFQVFKSNFDSKEKFEVIKKIQSKINQHFGFDCKLIVLLRWMILMKMANAQLNGDKKRITEYLQMLEFIRHKE